MGPYPPYEKTLLEAFLLPVNYATQFLYIIAHIKVIVSNFILLNIIDIKLKLIQRNFLNLEYICGFPDFKSFQQKVYIAIMLKHEFVFNTLSLQQKSTHLDFQMKI